MTKKKKNFLLFVLLPFIVCQAANATWQFGAFLTNSPQLWNFKTITVYDFITQIFLHPMLILSIIFIFIASYILHKNNPTIES